VVILLWVYYTTMIYFFGIEMVYTYAHRFGSQRERRPGAPPLVSDPEALKPGEQPGTP
jgi:uncharacterized BrkB/YihY/UPF0761 family membrane protein